MLLAAAGEIKLATLVPAGTTWHKALLEMGNTWNKDTDGRVTLTVFAGGQQGDESTTDQEDAAGDRHAQASFLTAAGLAELDEAFNVFAMPFFFEIDEEETAVEKKLTPMLEQRLQAKGFHLLELGHRRLDSGVLEEAAALARRREGGEALHDQGRRQVGAVVRVERLSPGAAAAGRHPGAAEARHRPHRHRAQSALPGALAPDLPRREVHARPPHRAADGGDAHLEQPPGTGSAPKTAQGDRRRAGAREDASAPRRRRRTPSRSRR